MVSSCSGRCRASSRRPPSWLAPAPPTPTDPPRRLPSLGQARTGEAAMGTETWSGGIDELARTVSDEERRAIVRAVPSAYDVQFTWDYAKGERPALSKLYEK